MCMDSNKSDKKKQWQEQYKADLVRYANRLETEDISVFPENVQNMIVLFLSRWTAKRELEVRIPLNEFRNRMHLTKQRNSYIKELCKATFGSSAIELNYPDGSFCVTSLIDRIGFKNDSNEPYVYAIAKPEFMPIFDQLQGRYTQYMATTFLSIKGIYAKNLFRIFAKNYKGHCSLKKDDFVHAMGIPSSYGTSKITNVINKAIAELRQKQIYQEITCTKIIGPGKGNPVIAYDFSYENGENLPDISAMQKSTSTGNDRDIESITDTNTDADNNNINDDKDRLICPYCGDAIVESYNRNNNTYFYRHKHWNEHKNCKLKNQDTYEDMISAINTAKKAINESDIKEKMAKYWLVAIKSLSKKFPNRKDTINYAQATSDDIERNQNCGFTKKEIYDEINWLMNHPKEIADVNNNDDDVPFPEV